MAAEHVTKAAHRAAARASEANDAVGGEPWSSAQARTALCQVVTNALEVTGQPGELGPLSSCRVTGAGCIPLTANHAKCGVIYTAQQLD